jgi:phosphoglycerol transferase MdoB-like AlkP superfamily enzyme
MTVVEKNDGSYLSAGEVSFLPGSFIDFISILFFVYAFVCFKAPLPMVFGFFAVVFCILSCVWFYVLRQYW